MVSVRVPAQTDTISIARAKTLLQKGNETKPADQKLVIMGYFFKDPSPLLLADKKWASINKRMPDSVYLIISGPLKDLFDRKYQGKLLRVTGLIQNAQLPNGKPQFIATTPPTILTPEK
jgi:hypothetical protein